MAYDYNNLLTILEQSREPLDALLLAEKLADKQSLGMDYKRGIEDLIERNTKLSHQAMDFIIKQEVRQLNYDLIEKYNINYNAVICSSSTGKYTISAYKHSMQACILKGEFKYFEKDWKNFKKQVEKTSSIIAFNRQQYKPLIEKAFNKLCEEYSNTYNGRLSLSIDRTDKDIDKVIISDSFTKCQLLISMTDQIVDWSEAEEQLINKMNNGFVYEQAQGKRDKINEWVISICQKYGLPEIQFNQIKNLSSETYFDINNGIINININLSNISVMARLENDFRNAAFTIMSLRKCSTWYDKTNINISPNMNFKFKEEKILDRTTYNVFESRFGKYKSQLIIFKDGKRLTGRTLRKTIILLGYGRKAETP
jgi:hypothetical protein